jgi:transglutaminase-like putative cysteine protease
MIDMDPSAPFDKRPDLPLLLAVALGPHVTWLPGWITVWCLGLWGFVLLAAHRGYRPPGRALRLILAGAGLAGVGLTYGHLRGMDAGVSMLAVLLGVKPLEITNIRDRMVTLFLAYFLVLSNLLEDTGLGMTLYLAAAVLWSLAVMIRMNHPDLTLVPALKRAGRMLVLAVPLTAALFVLFPRLPGGLFRLPDPAVRVIGFGEVVAPGDVGRLVQSGETAFRAEFEGPPPPFETLYWRGLVLWQYDGRAWRRSPVPGPGAEPIRKEAIHRYTITLEPHHRPWLFGLDRALGPPPGASYAGDHGLVSARDVHNQIRYTLTSALEYRTGPLKGWERRWGLGLPKEGNPRARDLAASWVADGRSPAGMVQAALDYFRNQPFFYTLDPPALGPDGVDDFLFTVRRGYCEHYASAFAFLMRSAGVPARVVVGYLGGERNPSGGYFIVRQADAHAWVEVAVNDEGWMRVDPTAAVAPQRVLRGVEAAVDEAPWRGFWTERRLGWVYPYWLQARWNWDRLGLFWTRTVLDYTYERQRSWLARMGLKTGTLADTMKNLVVGLAILGVTVAALTALIALRRRSPRQDPVREQYDRFARHAARLGPARPPAQGPRDYLSAFSRARPDLAPLARDITDTYIRLRYSPHGQPSDRKRLSRLVRTFGRIRR